MKTIPLLSILLCGCATQVPIPTPTRLPGPPEPPMVSFNIPAAKTLPVAKAAMVAPMPEKQFSFTWDYQMPLTNGQQFEIRSANQLGAPIQVWPILTLTDTNFLSVTISNPMQFMAVRVVDTNGNYSPWGSR